MGVLDRFEKRLDRIVNGAFARTFKAEVEPVEVAAALQRECDDRAAIVDRSRRVVPNVFTVELGPHDYERLSPYAEPLDAEFSSMVREHAEEVGYVFFGPVEVSSHNRSLASELTPIMVFTAKVFRTLTMWYQLT